jgi:hypothetical protein
MRFAHLKTHHRFERMRDQTASSHNVTLLAGQERT